MEGAAGHSGSGEEEEAVAESAAAVSSISPAAWPVVRARPGERDQGRGRAGALDLGHSGAGVCWQEVVCFVSVRRRTTVWPVLRTHCCPRTSMARRRSIGGSQRRLKFYFKFDWIRKKKRNNLITWFPKNNFIIKLFLLINAITY